jgi:hypothetical protein
MRKVNSEYTLGKESKMSKLNRSFGVAFSGVLCAAGLCLAQNQSTTTIVQPPEEKTTIVQPPEKTTVVQPPSNTTIVNEPEPEKPHTMAKEDSLEAVATQDTVGGIAPSEIKTLQRRRQAKNFSAAGFGPAGFGNVDEDGPSYDIYLGRFWEVNSRAAIKALGEMASDFNENHFGSFNLGANFYAMPTDFSPYVGAGAGLAYGSQTGDNGFGFDVGASIGALLFRTATAQMNLEGNAKMLMTELNDEAPTVYSARLGVLF